MVLQTDVCMCVNETFIILISLSCALTVDRKEIKERIDSKVKTFTVNVIIIINILVIITVLSYHHHQSILPVGIGCMG